MKRTYFHGTTADHLPAILKEGLRTDCDKLWGPSLDEIYFWSPDRLVEVGECDAEYADEYAKNRAYENAQIALTQAKSGQCIVLECELDDSTVHDDDSCENMSGAVATRRPVKPKQIKRIWISPDLSLLRGYFIYLAMNLDLFAGSFSPLECKIAEAIGKAEIYFESDDFPLTEYVVGETPHCIAA